MTYKHAITRQPFKLTGEQAVNAIRLFEAARQATPTPLYSHYFVRAGGITIDGRAVFGGNHEIGGNQSACAEKSLISNAGGEQLAMIGFWNLEGGVATPCGSCRDYLREYAANDFLVLWGSEGKEDRLVLPGKELYFENYQRLENRKLDDSLKPVIEEAKYALKNAYRPYNDGKKAHGAAFVTNGGVFLGSMNEDACFDGVPPVISAIETLRNASKEPKRLQLEALVVFSLDMPQVSYRERQHLHEFVSAVNAYFKKSSPLSVYLVFGTQVWKTDSTEWLPHPFDYSKFMEGGLERIKKQIGNLLR